MRSTVPSTATSARPRSKERRLQQGQAIVLIGLLILVLFAMLGLAIDSGRAYVDRRDQQTAVDAAALAAGDWFENYSDISQTGSTITQSVQLYQNDLRLYSGWSSSTYKTTLVGANGNLPQATWTFNYPGNYTLTVIATNTQFNGYQFSFSSVHLMPLAFMQIFGGPTTSTIVATATSIVGNQRQTPAILTLNPTGCSLTMHGGGTLTVLGDVYANGQACVDSNLNEAGNCYGGAGSTCSSANYWCYNATPGFIPYPPDPVTGQCNPGDVYGGPVVPAPSLPDPGYLAPSISYYTTGQSFNLDNRGTYTEMYPGSYAAFHLSGASPPKCAFLDAGVYQWSGGYTSDATGSLLSNELKAPDEEWIDPNNPANGPGTTAMANPQFWNLNSAGCAGNFSLSVSIVSGFGIKHGGLGIGNWGVELTSVRFDQFLDPSTIFSPNPCLAAPGCRRESAPSACQSIATADIKDQVIDVSITQNAPGAEYYNVYLNPNGCLPYLGGSENDFSFIGRFNAPGFSGGAPVGPYPNGTGVVLTGGTGGWTCGAAGHTICAVTASGLLPNSLCFAQVRTKNCQPPDDELSPQCFSSCTPPPTDLSQENAPMELQYPIYTGGDVANENYCQQSPASGGDPAAPCATAKITPGAVQFYFPAGQCMSQNAQGATYVFSGEQYNWIVIYEQPSTPVSCADTMNGGASTQYIGTIYTPSSSWSINGGDRSPLAGQVIAWTADVTGGAQVGVDFNPNYAPAPPAARLIN
jgi:Flp pilus assembly protein TadG